MMKGGQPLTRDQINAGLEAAERLHAGELPSDAELADAPVLDLWAFESIGDGLVRLVGIVHGHPILDDGSCWTSPLLAIDRHRMWARTVSRLYRLGKSLGDAIDG